MLDYIRSTKRYFNLRFKYPADKILQSWYYQYAEKLKRFKDVHRGEDCFIIGNGPSLNKMSLDNLNGYHTFGLNKIYLIFEREYINLSYHVSVNQLVINQSLSEFKKLECPSFLSYQKTYQLTGDEGNINFILTSGRPYMFQPNISEAICEGNTVTYVALQIAFYMGFEKVFLIGVDHNFKYSGSPNEKQVLANADPNHFDSRYFENQEWHLPDLEASELAFHLAKFHFKCNKRSIHDATVDGKLTVFDKMSFDDALKTCRKRKSQPLY